jgi:hypothetical protein
MTYSFQRDLNRISENIYSDKSGRMILVDHRDVHPYDLEVQEELVCEDGECYYRKSDNAVRLRQQDADKKNKIFWANVRKDQLIKEWGILIGNLEAKNVYEEWEFVPPIMRNPQYYIKQAK